MDYLLFTKMLNNLLDSPSLLASISDRAMANAELLSPPTSTKGYSVVCKFTIIFCQRFLYAPAFREPTEKSVGVHADSPRPLGHGKRNAIMCEVMGRTLVVCLLLLCLPAAVVRFVVSVVVDPPYGSSIERFAPHVCEEVLEGFQPSGADGYLARAVMLEQCMVRVVASRLHVLPASVFASFPICRVGCVSVGGHSAPCAARACVAAAKRYSHYDQFCAAFTSTVPVRTFVALEGFASVSKDSEFSVDVTSLVFHPGVNPQWAAFTASLATARSEVVPCDEVCIATVAQDIPVDDLAASLANSSHYKTAKAMTSKIFEIVGASDRIVRRHSSTPVKLDCDIEPGRSTTTALARFILA